jgi:hypothetical protein
MEYAVRKTGPDAVIHLGDHIGDAKELQRMMPALTFYMAAGNCDPQPPGEDEMLRTIENVRILITHGHKYRVKSGLMPLLGRAEELGADLALFGHTHGALIKQERGVVLMNPGQTERHNERQRASYGIVTAADGNFSCEIVYLPGELYDAPW